MKRDLALGGALFVAAMAAAAVLLDRAVAPPEVLIEAPPLRAEEAAVWLARRAPTPDEPALGHPAWASLAVDPQLSLWFRHAVPPEALPPAAQAAVVVHAWPPGLLNQARRAAGLDPELVAFLLTPKWADAAATACPGAPERWAPLCDDRSRTAAEEALDGWAARVLAQGDSPNAQALLDAMPDLGPRGVAIARAALAEGNEQGRARALLALSWSAGRASEPDLRAALLDPGALPPLVAALELGRLGLADADADLAQLQARLEGSGDAVLVAYARRLAAGDAFMEGPARGL